MNKVAQCMVKAAQLRAHATKLEKVALLLDDSDEITGADLGVGAGALGLLGGGAYGVNKLMQNRAAAKAAAEAAAQAAAAEAAKAARKSKLLKGVLGLGGAGVLGALGVGAYGLHKYNKRHGHFYRWHPHLRPKSFGDKLRHNISAAISGLRLPHNVQEPSWVAEEEPILKRMRLKAKFGIDRIGGGFGAEIDEAKHYDIINKLKTWFTGTGTKNHIKDYAILRNIDDFRLSGVHRRPWFVPV